MYFKLKFSAFAVVALLTWLMQPSLATYAQETYHRELWKNALTDHAAWRLGTRLQQQWLDRQHAWQERLSAFDRRVVSSVNQIWFGDSDSPLPSQAPTATTPLDTHATSVPRQALDNVTTHPQEPAAAPIASAAAPDTPIEAAEQTLADPRIVLKPKDLVFYVGDSMMQGVAPHLRRTLFKEHAIEGIDLSKQSTGLAYTGFFDWPGTVQKTFEQNPQIRLMVVFLGPNDPWDFPLEKGKPYARFQSEAWETAYRARIRHMLETAHAHGSEVIWLEVPSMRRKKLRKAMQYLNGLYASEVALAGGRFVQINTLLGNTEEGDYAAHASIDGRHTKVRLDDGIHFTVRGQKMIADAILAHIATPPPAS